MRDLENSYESDQPEGGTDQPEGRDNHTIQVTQTGWFSEWSSASLGPE